MSTPTRALGALVFYVRDLERTRDFYRDVLGIDLGVLGEGDDRILTGASGDVSLVFFPDPTSTPGTAGPVAVFELADGIEAAVAALLEHNVEIVTPLTHAPDGGLTADFRDPTGYVLSYYQAPA